jgi:sugar phosphate isomerase/epimerase
MAVSAGFGAASALFPGAAMAHVAGPAKPAFGLGMVTYNIGKDLALPDLLKVAREGGVQAIELRTSHKHGVEPSLSANERAEVRKRFADAGIIPWGCGSVCEFHSTDPAVVRKNLDECKRFVELVADIGAKGVKVRPNGFNKNEKQADTLKRIGDAVRTCAENAAAAKVEIWVEVHGAGTQEPANMQAIMKHCGHPSAGVTWNSNPTDVKNGSVKASFELLGPYIKSCHINDLYKNDTGAYPYAELFGLLKGLGYDRYTLIEVGRTPGDAAACVDYLRYYKALWSRLAGEGA